jgi:hypothetical protein
MNFQQALISFLAYMQYGDHIYEYLCMNSASFYGYKT